MLRVLKEPNIIKIAIIYEELTTPSPTQTPSTKKKEENEFRRYILKTIAGT
jgi:hypothetical protein